MHANKNSDFEAALQALGPSASPLMALRLGVLRVQFSHKKKTEYNNPFGIARRQTAKCQANFHGTVCAWPLLSFMITRLEGLNLSHFLWY